MPLKPEAVGLVDQEGVDGWALDGDAGALADRLGAAGVVQVAVGDQIFSADQALVLDRRQQPVDLAARVDDRDLQGLGARRWVQFCCNGVTGAIRARIGGKGFAARSCRPMIGLSPWKRPGQAPGLSIRKLAVLASGRRRAARAFHQRSSFSSRLTGQTFDFPAVEASPIAVKVMNRPWTCTVEAHEERTAQPPVDPGMTTNRNGAAGEVRSSNR